MNGRVAEDDVEFEWTYQTPQMIEGIIVTRGGKDMRVRGKEVDENET